MIVVAGLSLKNLEPRVWDAESPYYLQGLSAIMVSYADFKRMPSRRRAAMKGGLRQYLGLSRDISVYLDNGAFFFATSGGEPSAREYGEFVRKSRPDWQPIRFDAIPFPSMSPQKQAACFRRTVKINKSYQHDGYVPVVHAGKYLRRYLDSIERHEKLSKKPCIALGGLVPNLLRKPSAAAYSDIVDNLIEVRRRFPNKRIHVFGIGGTATLHLAGLLGFDSVDSSGWRNRAARGIIQLPGSGERVVAELGSWRGRRPTADEWTQLDKCGCPACRTHGASGLKANGLPGFCNRAAHNLWILLEEARWIEARLVKGTYARSYRRRLNNSVYLPIITRLLERLNDGALGSTK